MTAAVLIVVAAVVAVSVGLAGRSRPSAGGPAVPSPPPKVLVFPAHSLAPAHGALFGSWIQPAAFTVPAQQASIAAFERAIGRKLAIDNLYVPWPGPMPIALAKWDLRRHSIPMISWDAARSSKIVAGTDNAQIRATALQLKALHGPVLLRWFAEMNLGQNRHDTGSPATFVAAWRHMHRIFTSVGATNVRWVWCPSGSTFAASAGIAQAYYPGKAYVDWICADGYNWAPVLAGSSWRSFGQIFSPFYRWGLSTGKPMLIGEFGTVEGARGAKANWFRQADRVLRTQFPAIRAVVYFNSDHVNFGQHFDWKVTTSKSALAAFRAFAGDPYFNARPRT